MRVRLNPNDTVTPQHIPGLQTHGVFGLEVSMRKLVGLTAAANRSDPPQLKLFCFIPTPPRLPFRNASKM